MKVDPGGKWERIFWSRDSGFMMGGLGYCAGNDTVFEYSVLGCGVSFAILNPRFEIISSSQILKFSSPFSAVGKDFP